MFRSPTCLAALLLPLLLLSAEGSRPACGGPLRTPEEHRVFASQVMLALYDVLLLHMNVTEEILFADMAQDAAWWNSTADMAQDAAGWNSTEDMAQDAAGRNSTEDMTVQLLVKVIMEILPNMVYAAGATLANGESAWLANVSDAALVWLTNQTNLMEDSFLYSIPPMVWAAMDQLKDLDPDAYEESRKEFLSFNYTGTSLDTMLWGMDQLRAILSRVAWCTRARNGCATVVPLTCVADGGSVLFNMDHAIADIMDTAQKDCSSENASMINCMTDIALGLNHLANAAENLARVSKDCWREDLTHQRMTAETFSWFALTTKSSIDVANSCTADSPDTGPKPVISMCDLSTLDVLNGVAHVADSIDSLLQVNEEARSAQRAGELTDSVHRLASLLDSRSCEGADADSSPSSEPPSAALRHLRGLR